MRVDQIWRYPVKSMAGERLEHAELRREGIPGDRTLYVVDAHGRVLTARNHPRLLGLRAAVDAEGEVLVDGAPWYDPRTEAAVRAAAGEDAQLVPASGSERFDILPLLVATDGSIHAFGHDLRRLRPNIVISGVEGLAERQWEGRLLAVGSAVIALADLRGRCIMTTLDPDTLEQDIGVYQRIRSRFGGRLALNAWAGREGRIEVGDEVALLASDADVDPDVPLVGRYV
jgi:MOSC domain-containing protein